MNKATARIFHKNDPQRHKTYTVVPPDVIPGNFLNRTNSRVIPCGPSVLRKEQPTAITMPKQEQINHWIQLLSECAGYPVKHA